MHQKEAAEVPVAKAEVKAVKVNSLLMISSKTRRIRLSLTEE